MKFTDGYWLMRPGVTARYATEVADVRADEHRMTLYAPVKHVRRRGGMLNSALLTVECWSPAEGVIGVRATHHAGSGRRRPEFALPGAQPDVGKVCRDGAVVELSAGELSLRVDTSQPWHLEFTADGRVLTSVGERGTGFVTDAAGRHFMLGQLSLGVGESVYGLGERFTPFVKNGQAVDIWQADGGTSSEQAYKNIPFHLTNRGYGVFVNHPGKVSYEIGSESVGQAQFSVEDQSLEFFVVHGPTSKQILQRYTALTGRPALPPAWALGLWLTTSFTTDYDEATVNRFVDGMAERGIPLSVFHFDCFWMRGYQWCDFAWDSDTFPDPAGMLSRLKQQGLRISAWINPYIAQKSAMFEEAMREGYLVRRPDGSVWQWDLWQPGMALVDFTNPAARDWYTGKLKTLLDQGVDCFKTDFGERISTDVVWHDGSDPERMHNYYTHLYNQAVFELLRAERGEGEALLFARSATAGGQQYPVHWGGDCASHFNAMAESLRGGLSLGLSGFGFWSHDIGGFEGTPTPAVFKRWVQFGLLSSHSRLHGSKSYRVPWDYGEEAVDVTREFTLLKHRLAPYLQRAAQQAHTTGVPVMRALVLEFPDDPTAATLDRQYMLGDDLLVAPVFTDDGTVEYYVPEGTWTNVLTGTQITGPRWAREQHGFHTLPLLARPDSVIALAADDQHPVSAWADGVELRVHAFADGAEHTVVIPSTDGPGETARFHLRRRGGRLHVTTDSPHPWQLRIGGPNATVHTRPAGTSEADLPYPA
ncbi:alpha-xylosidase [Streptomyces sp. NPDC057136]|uniref:alpha-xylosidase n=1 Tax=Streptomyces sp. NPDC057136 TaxID=3346029 RepID=UPI0036346A3E